MIEDRIKYSAYIGRTNVENVLNDFYFDLTSSS